MMGVEPTHIEFHVNLQKVFKSRIDGLPRSDKELKFHPEPLLFLTAQKILVIFPLAVIAA